MCSTCQSDFTVIQHYLVSQRTGIPYTYYPKFEPLSLLKNIQRKGDIARKELLLLSPQYFLIFVPINFLPF